MADGLPYQISWGSEAQALVKELLRDARNPLARAELARTIRGLNDQLKRDPRGVGVVYQVTGVIEERLATVDSIRALFAVDTERNYVAVRTCHALWRGNGKVPE